MTVEGFEVVGGSIHHSSGTAYVRRRSTMLPDEAMDLENYVESTDFNDKLELENYDESTDVNEEPIVFVSEKT